MTGERPMHPPEPLHIRMALARDKKGMKQADLAERARELGLGRIQQGRISSWERGAAIPVEAVQILARALDVDPGWLSHGEATAAPAPEWWDEDGQEESPLRGVPHRGRKGRVHVHSPGQDGRQEQKRKRRTG